MEYRVSWGGTMELWNYLPGEVKMNHGHLRERPIAFQGLFQGSQICRDAWEFCWNYSTSESPPNDIAQCCFQEGWSLFCICQWKQWEGNQNRKYTPNYVLIRIQIIVIVIHDHVPLSSGVETHLGKAGLQWEHLCLETNTYICDLLQGEAHQHSWKGPLHAAQPQEEV